MMARSHTFLMGCWMVACVTSCAVDGAPADQGPANAVDTGNDAHDTDVATADGGVGGQDDEPIDTEDVRPDTPQPPTCLDTDGDGAAGTGAECDVTSATYDCDDADDAIHPGAPEVCDGIDQDCDGDVDEGVANACGGCSTLDGAPGAACGSCGQLVCTSPDTLACADTSGNGCGGCDPLDQQLGSRCGTCGEWACMGANATQCVGDHAFNACGGCASLPQSPGDGCGTCDSGELVCDGNSSLRCQGDEGDGARNACGGCQSLSAAPGSGCGECGTYACNGSNAVRCNDPGANACGGCGNLSNSPGGACGSCGTWRCSGRNGVTCDDPGTNACGGCATLQGQPLDPCGNPGNCWRCNGANSVTCTSSPPCPS